MTQVFAVADEGSPVADKELRVTERFACDVPASCRPPADWKRGGQKWAARVRDVSTTGLCIVLGRRFERGAGLAIEVPGSDGVSPSTLLARVMRVHAEAGGSWALGCKFVSPLSDEELQALTRSVEEASPEEAVPEAAFVADVLFRGTLPDGRVVQRLIRKLNRDWQWPLAPGRTIGLRIRRSGGGSPAKLRVDACRAVDGRWVLEATFQGPQPAGF